MLNDDKKIDFTTLTGGEVEGNGLFDELMRSVNAHTQAQFDEGRLTPENFASVYLGAMQSCLSQASQFILQYQTSNQQVRLLDAQIENEELNKQLIQKQIDKLEADTEYVNKQVLKVDSEKALIDAQTSNQTKQGLVLDQTVENAIKDLEVKTKNIQAQEAQTALVTQQTVNAVSQDDQIKKQTLKLQAEIDVLSQRVISELAQTNDTVNGQPIGGVLGKQFKLYDNQAEGYTRDAEQKAAKILNDTFLTRVTTDADNWDAVTAGQGDLEVAKVMSKLKQGIGVI